MTTIEVTREDIEAGSPFHCEACPIALAISRHLLPGFHAAVGGLWIRIVQGFHVVARFDTPEQAFQFMKAFDRGLTDQPISFPLDIPAEFLKGGAE